MSDPQGSYERVMPGVVVGIVRQTTGDPENLGRIRVEYKMFSGTILSSWCRVASFFAGKDRGAYFLPEPETEVLVAFEAGNMNVPYVIGALWNGQDTPPVAGEAQQQSVKVIKTRGGSVIKIDDTEGSEQIQIVDKSGSNSILIDIAAKRVAITSEGNIDLTASQGKITLTAADVQISATNGLTMSAGAEGAKLTAGGTVVVQGTQIRLN
ncbi:phage baseplate assembly protein V [Sorangium sp. So ce726]|uniref:phage baseplate assembly protein V n=1 Tax=Sorangium sp. So ce726 TaxID=3133319 RepID=UPI003F623D0F